LPSARNGISDGACRGFLHTRSAPATCGRGTPERTDDITKLSSDNAAANDILAVKCGLGGERSDLFQVGAFIRHTVGSACISAALAYGWQDITTDRAVLGLDRLSANFNANAFSGRVEGGYRIVNPWIGLTPYAVGQFTTVALPTYTEQVLGEPGPFALNYTAKNATASRCELGLRTDKSFALNNAVLTLRGRAAWAHNFDTDRSIAATFQSLPGASFVVNDAAPGTRGCAYHHQCRDGLAQRILSPVTFEGEFSDVTRSYADNGSYATYGESEPPPLCGLIGFAYNKLGSA
jgi:hypothetical protein